MLKLRWPQSAHQEYWEHNNCALAYEYDPTDDGPETVAARLILASHTQEQLDLEAGRFASWQLGEMACV